MALANYTDLQAKVVSYLNRTDMATHIVDAVALAEADLRRNLRQKSVVASLTLTAGVDSVALPVTVSQLRSIRFDTANEQNNLVHVSMAMLGTVRRISSGRPLYYAIVDGTLYLDCSPGTSYNMEINYYEKLVPLATISTNSTLTDSPDLYLYATLKEMEPFLEHDERNPMWADKYRQALEDENNLRERAEFGAAPLRIGLPVVFG